NVRYLTLRRLARRPQCICPHTLHPAMRILPLLSLALLVPAVVSAQATRTTNAKFRATPNGVLIATLHKGATVERGETRGEWTRVTLQGYVYKTGIGGKRDTFRISAASD